MKFLNFQTFTELAELTARANGKTAEAVKAALNCLFNGANRHVLYIGHNQVACEYARKLATGLVKEHPEYHIDIRASSRFAVEFLSGLGSSVLIFSPFLTAARACRGRTLDEIIFDVELDTLFKDSQKEDSKFRELLYSVAPCMAHRPKVNHKTLIKYF